mgnify:CR=1 FL=1
MPHQNARQAVEFGFGQPQASQTARRQFMASLALAGLFGALALSIAFVASRDALRLPGAPAPAQVSASFAGALSTR